MKRFRAKLVGLGLAAVAGSAVAGEERQPGGLPEPAGVARPADPPGPPAAGELDPIWLPAPRREPGAPIPTPPSAATPPVPEKPRAVAVPSSPAFTPPPPIPVPAPAVRVPPATSAEVWRTPGQDDPIPPPRTIDGPPKLMPQPVPPPDILPRPRPLEPMPTPTPTARPTYDPRPFYGAPAPPGAELPAAPPELMVPVGGMVPDKHEAFGSPPIRLGRDYPSLSQLCGGLSGRDPAWAPVGFLGDGLGPPRAFASAEYLLWWMSPLNVPILGTTNPDPRRFGFLGEPGTTSIVGPGQFLGSARNGFRARGGFWLDDHGGCAVDGSVFFLGRQTGEVTFSPDQLPIITRPIFSPNPRPGGGGVIGQTGEAVAVPGILRGFLTVRAESELWGADANIRHCLCTTCDTRASWFVGYRYLNLRESVAITENITVVGNPAGRVLIPDPVGTIVFVQDRFATENSFNGGQVGATYERRFGRFSLDGRASVAFGVTHQELDIFGIQTRTRPGQPPVSYRGGLLAAGPNLGHFSRDYFSVVPEVTLNVGYWLTPNFKAFVGYNFLYWSNVIRPGDQIDPVVDLTFVPNGPRVPPSGLNRPAAPFRQSDLWINGVQFGVEWRW